MNGRVDSPADLATSQQAATPFVSQAIVTPVVDPIDADDREGPSLPSDHPAWMRDAISLSARARALLANVAPVVLRVVAFWEHRTRAIDVGGRTLLVDSSGSYRFER